MSCQKLSLFKINCFILNKEKGHFLGVGSAVSLAGRICSMWRERKRIFHLLQSLLVLTIDGKQGYPVVSDFALALHFRS